MENIKNKIPLTGQYNNAIYVCPFCSEILMKGKKFGEVQRYSIGYADSYLGLMNVIECPNCFEKFYFHAF
jgi:hypothetical protein